jgi:GcrA cell cycle regulator
MQTSWEPKHSDALREHLAKGLPYSEIARRINAAFDTAYTRNATIGRARRMGLAGVAETGRSKTPRKSGLLPFRKMRKTRKHRATKPRLPRPVLKRASVLKLRCVGIEPRHLSLLELEARDCRYPYGGDRDGEAITFCGHPRRAGLELLHRAFSFDAGRRCHAGSIRHQGPAAAGGGGMTRKSPPIGAVAARIRLLSPRHRRAHLRALIHQQPDGSIRRSELAALLRDQSPPPANENRAP